MATSTTSHFAALYKSWKPQPSIGTAAVSDKQPPTPTPKDSPAGSQTPDLDHEGTTPPADLTSLIRPGRLSRAGSVYSLSRVSFTSQISQLTAIRLPDAAFLKSSISAISTSTAAAKALTDSSEQIRLWIQKASDVLEGLDAGDDVEWAAAAGREGLNEVNHAIDRFEGLVQVFVASVEELQLRKDTPAVPASDMTKLVDQVERVTVAWLRIKKSLAQVKLQVELAMEWEQLYNGAFGDISNDLEGLTRIVFEMEERRHSLGAHPPSIPQDRVLDIDELETIVHDAPQRRNQGLSLDKRFSMELNLQPPPLESPGLSTDPNESGLLELFARMQPLRASLDFLPMRLSTFRGKAIEIFPSACDELLQCRDRLESQWQKLERDADSLRKELSEDRWNLVFRNAGKQAMKLIDSVERSLIKVDESLGTDTQLKHTSSTTKKIENYEAKKLHYCPAIDRVLAIVEKGVRDRLTVNGEIVRLRAELQQRWQTLQRDMKHMDAILEEYAADIKNVGPGSPQQLRDSLSSILSTERSLTSSIIAASPGSSPPSSVVSNRSRRGSSHDQKTPASAAPMALSNDKPQQSNASPPARKDARSLQSARLSQDTPTKTPLPANSTTSSFHTTPNHTSTPIKSSRLPSRQTPPSDRPRWNYSRTSNSDYNVSAYYKSLKSKASASSVNPAKAGSRVSSFNSALSPNSSPLSPKVIPTTRSTSSTRSPLSRKASDLSLASSSTRPRDASQTRTGRTPTPRDSPWNIQKRASSQAARTAIPTLQTPPTAIKPGPSTSPRHTSIYSAASIVSSSQFSSPTSSPRTSIGPVPASSATGGPRSRSSSHIPVPIDPRSTLSSSHAETSNFRPATNASPSAAKP